jgi:hypothetical protein
MIHGNKRRKRKCRKANEIEWIASEFFQNISDIKFYGFNKYKTPDQFKGLYLEIKDG